MQSFGKWFNNKRERASSLPKNTIEHSKRQGRASSLPKRERASFTSTLAYLLQPPEERRLQQKQHESKQLIQDIIAAHASHDKTSPTTLASYISIHNTRGDLHTHHSSDLLLALVMQEVKDEERGELWLSASGGKSKMLAAPPGYFQQLCSSPENVDNQATKAAIKQIDLDVGRTAGVAETGETATTTPATATAKKEETDFASVSLSSLRKVLVATSRHLPHVGYCQSMNFLAAMLLEQLEEEEAFWVLVSIADDILKGYYTLSLIGCRVDQRVFSELIRDMMPDVSHNVDEVMCIPAVGILSYHWFLTIFVTTINSHTMLLRLWDVFFVRGARSIFQIALAIFESAAPKLREATEIPEISIAIDDSLRSFSKDSLINAVLGLQGAVVTTDRIKKMRATHMKELRQEEQMMQRRMSRIKSQPTKKSMRNLKSKKSLQNLKGDPNQNTTTATVDSSNDGPGTESRSVRRRSVVFKMTESNEGTTKNNQTEQKRTQQQKGQNNTNATTDTDPGDTESMPFVLSDLLEIEKAALVEMYQIVENANKDNPHISNIDGRQLCVMNRSTFEKVWPIACQDCTHGERWLSWHSAIEVFDAFSFFKQSNAPLKSQTDQNDENKGCMVVDFRDLLCGLSVFCNGGNRTSKLKFIYSVYDTDRNESLDHDELYDLMSAVYATCDMDDGGDGGDGGVDVNVEHYVKAIFSKLGSEEEQSLNFSQFREVAVMHPVILQYLAETGSAGSSGSDVSEADNKSNKSNTYGGIRSVRSSSVEMLGKTSFAKSSLVSIVLKQHPSFLKKDGQEPPMRIHPDVVTLPFVQAMGVGDGGQHGEDDVVVLPNGTTMSDYYVMLRTFNQVCFDLERCTKELAIERKVHISIEDELLEVKKREITLERRLVEEKANSAINKQMLNEVLLSREESPLKHNHSFNKN